MTEKKPEHYFTSRQTSEIKYGIVKATILGREYSFYTCSGLFSWKEIDRGTWTLIKYMRLPDAGSILDLGCGFGAVGIVAAALKPQGKVLLTDINYRAVHMARKTIKEMELSNASARTGNLFEKIPEKFDTILVNPPFAAGLETVFRFIAESKQHLYPHGTLQVVARHNKGGARVQEKIEDVFGNSEVLGKSGGFRVYMGTNEHK
ncbi:MAG: methyltransferase [archaeon]